MQSYIYAHVNPDTGEVLYIGRGTGARAWTTHKRSAPHLTFLENVNRLGYAPTTWGAVLCAGLDAEEAREVETALIKTIQPIFNQMGICAANAGRGENNHNAVLSDIEVRQMRRDHAEGGASIRELGRRYGVAYTTARKIIREIVRI